MKKKNIKELNSVLKNIDDNTKEAKRLLSVFIVLKEAEKEQKAVVKAMDNAARLANEAMNGLWVMGNVRLAAEACSICISKVNNKQFKKDRKIILSDSEWKNYKEWVKNIPIEEQKLFLRLLKEGNGMLTMVGRMQYFRELSIKYDLTLDELIELRDNLMKNSGLMR